MTRTDRSPSRNAGSRCDPQALYEAMSDFIRAYQFRDKDRTLCHGITVTQCYALDGVIRSGPLSLNDLAQHLYLDKSTVSRVVDAMEKKKLLMRITRAADRRAVEIRPTAKGKRLHERIARDAGNRHWRLIKDLDPRQRERFIELLRRFASAATESISRTRDD